MQCLRSKWITMPPGCIPQAVTVQSVDPKLHGYQQRTYQRLLSVRRGKLVAWILGISSPRTFGSWPTEIHRPACGRIVEVAEVGFEPTISG